jgi:hypothetical protein
MNIDYSQYNHVDGWHYIRFIIAATETIGGIMTDSGLIKFMRTEHKATSISVNKHTQTAIHRAIESALINWGDHSPNLKTEYNEHDDTLVVQYWGCCTFFFTNVWGNACSGTLSHIQQSYTVYINSIT